MADSFLPYQNPTTTDAKLDSEQLVVGANTVERERIQIAGDSATDIAPVTAVDGLLVKVSNTVPVSGTVSVTEPVSIDDNGGSITVDGAVTVSATDLDIRDLAFATDKADVSGSSGVGVTGTFFQATQPVSAVALPLPTGAATSALQTQPGVDIGDVTINNAGGGAAVSIQDGGNTITVDGAVTVSGTATVSATDLDIRDLVFATDKVDVSGSTGVGVTGTFFQATQPVSVASLPLPADAATETTQLLVLAALGGSSTTVYSTIDDTRRLQEQNLLESMRQSNFLMGLNEPDGRYVRGFELR